MRKRYVLHILIVFITVLTLALSGSFVLSSYAADNPDITRKGVTVTNYTLPDESIKEGDNFRIRGSISSDTKISKIKVGVVKKKGGKWTSVKHTAKGINKYSYNLESLTSKVRFGGLAPGKYYYRVSVTLASGSVRVINKRFNVVKRKESGKVSKTNKVKKIRVKKPGNFKVGKSFSVSGKLKSKETIKKIEIGIVFAPTNEWTDYKFTKKRVNSKVFTISQAAPSLKFNKLAAGEYRYRIRVNTSSGWKTVLNHPFTVKPSDKPAKAVKWAVRIANDDSFTYGKKPKASRPGCYFCGTNQIKKPKGYEKTYVCITFAGAAYAHGAKDKEIRRECRAGNLTMFENNTNFIAFSCWMKIGSCRELKIEDLQPGDVIIKWDPLNAFGHACIYVGGDKLVEASGGGWSPESIAVRSGAAARLALYSRGKKNYVMRYIH